MNEPQKQGASERGGALELTVREDDVTGMEELLGVMGEGTEALGLR